MKISNERSIALRGLDEPMRRIRRTRGGGRVVAPRTGRCADAVRMVAGRITIAIALALFPAWAAKAAFAQESPDAATAGRRLALQLCSGCHFVAPGQRVPMSVNAPPFQAIANNPDATEFRLRNALRVPHPIMPTLILSPEEVEDVVAYILSLKAR